MTRVALIGGGWIARSIVIGLEEAGASVVAIADPSEAARSRWADGKYQVFDDHRAMLEASRADVVCVLTPVHCHAEHTLDALEAGAHVLVEKPIASSLDQADAMIATAERLRRRVIVDESYVYMPPHRAAAEVIASGRVGAVKSLTMTFYGWRPRPEFVAGVAKANERFDSATNFDWLVDHAVHMFALSRLLTMGSEFSSVRALGGPREQDIAGGTWSCGEASVVWLRVTEGVEGVHGRRAGLHTLVVGERGYFTVLGEGGSWGDDGPRGAIRFDDGSVVASPGRPDLLWDADVGYYPDAHIGSVNAALAAINHGSGGYDARLGRADLAAVHELIASATG